MSQERDLASRLAATVAAQYEPVIAEAHAAAGQPPAVRRRTLARLRRELDRIRRRDYFSPSQRDRAHGAVQALREAIEEAAA